MKTVNRLLLTKIMKVDKTPNAINPTRIGKIGLT